MDTKEKVSGEGAEIAPAENEKKPKHQRKGGLLRSALTLYLALAILALSATVGWFALNTKVYIENETPGNIQVEVNSGNLQVSFDETGFGDKITMHSEELSYYIDISGNGEHLYFPKSLDENDEPFLYDVSTFVDVTGDTRYYIELRVNFRTTEKMDVYLSSESAISPAENFAHSDGAYSRTSLYGDIGCDGIVASARVAFFEPQYDDDGTETDLLLKNIWIPNDNVFLYYQNVVTEGVAKNTAFVSTDSSNSEARTRGYSYLAIDEANNCMEQIYYTADDYAYGNVSVSQNQLANSSLGGTINQGVPLVTFTEENELQTKPLVIRIWFEGTDREADKAFNGGEAKYLLSFIGIQKEECAEILHGSDDCTADFTPDETNKAIYYNINKDTLCYFSEYANMNEGGTGDTADVTVENNKLLYSLDGINWKSFTQTPIPEFAQDASGDKMIYVRIMETLSTKAGNIVTITIPKYVPPPPDPEPEPTA